MSGLRILKSHGRTIAVLIVTGAVFGLLFAAINPKRVLRTLIGANLWILWVAVLVGIAIEILKASRWQFTLDRSGYEVGLRRCLELELVAHPLNVVVPAKTGDAAKAYLLRHSVPLRTGLGTVAFVRGWDLLLLITFGTAGLLGVVPRSTGVGAVAVFTLAMVGTALLWFDVAGIRQRLWRRVPTPVQEYIRQRRSLPWRSLLVVTGWYSVLLFVLSIIQTLLLFYAVGIEVPPLTGILLIPVAVLVGLVPVTVGGMGTRDAAFVFLFAQYASPSSIVAVGLLYSVIRYWLLGLVGLPFMIRVRHTAADDG